MKTILIVSLCIILVLLLTPDILYSFIRVLKIRGIGKWEDKNIWHSAIKRKCIKWLERTPIIQKNDYKRLIIIDIIKREYGNNAIQSWQLAALIISLSEYAKDGCTEASLALEKKLKSIIDINGKFKKLPLNIDNSILAYALLCIPEIDINRIRPALNQIIEIIKKSLQKDGTVCYNRNNINIRFVDTIGLICPFLARYGKIIGDNSLIDLSIKHIIDYYELGFYNKANLPWHAYNTSGLPLGIYGWGRGVAWFSLGIIETFKEIDDKHQKKLELSQIIVDICNTIIKYQKSNGSWGCIFQLDSSISDSSATVMMAYMLKQSIEYGLIDRSFNSYISAAVNYLMKVTRKDGAIEYSQGDTKGIGFYSESFRIMPFTQGYLLKLLFNL